MADHAASGTGRQAGRLTSAVTGGGAGSSSHRAGSKRGIRQLSSSSGSSSKAIGHPPCPWATTPAAAGGHASAKQARQAAGSSRQGATHRVHGGRHQRRAQADVARDVGGQVHLAGGRCGCWSWVLVGAGGCWVGVAAVLIRPQAQAGRAQTAVGVAAAALPGLSPGPHLVRAKVDVARQEDHIVVRVAHTLAEQLGGGEACAAAAQAGGGWAAAAAAGGGGSGGASCRGPPAAAERSDRSPGAQCAGLAARRTPCTAPPHRRQGCRQRRGARSRSPLWRKLQAVDGRVPGLRREPGDRRLKPSSSRWASKPGRLQLATRAIGAQRPGSSGDAGACPSMRRRASVAARRSVRAGGRVVAAGVKARLRPSICPGL